MKFSDIISGCLNVFPVDFLSPRHPPSGRDQTLLQNRHPLHAQRNNANTAFPRQIASKRRAQQTPPKKRTEDSRIGTWNESTKNTHHDLLIHLSCFAPFPFTSETGTGASISSTDRADDPQCALIRKASHEPRIFNKTIHTLPTSH